MSNAFLPRAARQKQIVSRVNELRGIGAPGREICARIYTEFGVAIYPNQVCKMITDETRAAFERLVKADRVAGFTLKEVSEIYGISCREATRICQGLGKSKPRRKCPSVEAVTRSKDGEDFVISAGSVIGIRLPDGSRREYLVTSVSAPIGVDPVAYCRCYEYGLEVSFVLANERFRVLDVLDEEEFLVEKQKLAPKGIRMMRCG